MMIQLVLNIDKDIKMIQNIDVKQIQNGNGICIKMMDYEIKIIYLNNFFNTFF